MPRLFVALCLGAALLGLVDRAPEPVATGVPFPGWPATFEGRPIESVDLAGYERTFADGYPGRFARFTDGEREILLRWVVEPSRRIHPAATCLEAHGFEVEPLPVHVDGSGDRWSAFAAVRGSTRLRVRERIRDGSGRSWPDVSTWYWAAVLGRTEGPWWIESVGYDTAMEQHTTLRQRKERQENILTMLGEVGSSTAELEGRVAAMEAELGPDAYTDLIGVLTHIELSPSEAHERWRSILDHQHEMSVKLGRSVDVRVATLDYFLSIDRMLDNPKIVEIYVFDQVQESAITDGVTGAYNHRYFQLSLDREVERSRRFDKAFSIILIDLDGFKALNDRCGHPVGDVALREVARILMDGVRSVDLVSRYGGDEFVLVLPEVDLEGAKILAGRLVAAIHEAPFEGEERIPGGRLTASAGVASFPRNATEGRAVLMAADKALYEAKATGKDSVGIA